jgi:hypothetical protein
MRIVGTRKLDDRPNDSDLNADRTYWAQATQGSATSAVFQFTVPHDGD